MKEKMYICNKAGKKFLCGGCPHTEPHILMTYHHNGERKFCNQWDRCGEGTKKTKVICVEIK